MKKSLLYFLLAGCLGLLALIDFTLAWLVLIISLTCFLGLAFWQRIFREDINKLALTVLVLTFGLVFFFANPLLSFLSQSDFFNQLPREVALTPQASWRIALNSLRAEPLFGSGLGNFNYNFSKFKPANFWQDIFWQIRMAKSGNFTAELMATSGALGFLSWLAMILLFFWKPMINSPII